MYIVGFAIKICAGFRCFQPKRLVESRAMSIFRCEPHICATFDFEAKCRLASTELLFEVLLLYESFCHPCPGRLTTQHARCHKEYYSPRGQAVSTSHFRGRAQHPFCVSKAILLFWKPSTPQALHFLVVFRHLYVPRVHPCKPWAGPGFPILWIKLRLACNKHIKLSRKNTPGKNELVISCEIFTFPSKFYT